MPKNACHCNQMVSERFLTIHYCEEQHRKLLCVFVFMQFHFLVLPFLLLSFSLCELAEDGDDGTG